MDFKSGDYAFGSSVTFSSAPKTGYSFVNWTNVITNQTHFTNSLNLTVNDNNNLVENFEKVSYNISDNLTGQGEVQKRVGGGGTVCFAIEFLSKLYKISSTFSKEALN